MSAESKNNNKNGACTSFCYFYFILLVIYICYFTKLSVHQKLEMINKTKQDKLPGPSPQIMESSLL